jgi:hypothetical protein
MEDKELLDSIEDFIVNNYHPPLSSLDKANMLEHIIDLMDTRKKVQL